MPVNKKSAQKIIGVIPARYGSKRFPGKPLVIIKGKPMIQHVWEQASHSKYLDKVIIATDDRRIFDMVKEFGGYVVMTSKKHKSGTERVYEAVEKIPCDIVVNIQGDEPFIHPENIDLVIKQILVKKRNAATLCCRIIKKREIEDPNIVKVIVDKNHDAVYFSRYPIPYNRNKNRNVKYFKHIGLYAYNKIFLKIYVSKKQTKSEVAEKLEQLRILDNGEKISVIETKLDSISIDTKEDLTKLDRYSYNK